MSKIEKMQDVAALKSLSSKIIMMLSCPIIQTAASTEKHVGIILNFIILRSIFKTVEMTFMFVFSVHICEAWLCKLFFFFLITNHHF